MSGRDAKYLRKIIFLACVGPLLAGCGGGDSGGDNTLIPQIAGLDERPSNPHCMAPPRLPSETSVQLTRAFPQLEFYHPLAMTQAPGDSSHWYVIDQFGQVFRFANDDAVSTASLVIDLRDRVVVEGEGGMLDMAFDPDYALNRQVYFSYTGAGSPLTSYVSRFTSTDDGMTFDPGSEQIILALPQAGIVHLGGAIGFGPDGYLYVSFGDGFAHADGLGHGQNTDTLNGALLRLDLATEQPYVSPADNPFVAGGGRPEIYAWGFRNPWRWNFDQSTGELWLADVGTGAFEEINRIAKGGNYGWSIMEGSACFRPGSGLCQAPELIPPIVEYGHDQGCAVIGGYVYRGMDMPALNGTYLYGDFCSGFVWGLEYDESGNPLPQKLLESGLSIDSFAQAQDGELYLLDYAGGGLYRLESTAASDALVDFPMKLSETGCFDTVDPTQAAPGLIPYTVNAPFWSDGAIKQRWLAIPDGTTIYIEESGNWQFPIGSVLAKNFQLNGQLIETRLLVRHDDGGWAGYTYQWDDVVGDALLVRGGKTIDIQGVKWTFPRSAECLRCHTAASGYTLGLETQQLNGDMFYPRTARIANQLTTLDHIGMFSRPLNAPADDLPAWVNTADQSVSVDQRARAYLQVNCAQCHRPGGPTGRNMDLRAGIPFASMNICNRRAEGTDLGIDGMHLLGPADPDHSLLLARMNRRDLHAMPPLGSNHVDSEGVALIRQWIEELLDCR